MRNEIETNGTQLVFVHLSDEAHAQKFFAPYHLTDVPRIADSEGKLYEAFGLLRANWWAQHFHYRSLLRMFVASLNGNLAGLPAGDVERMPGVFLVVNGEVRKAFRHKLVSDRPDYSQLAAA